jgi:hypothetical protein
MPLNLSVMKRKKLDLNKKLVLNKETIANLTPAQQAKLGGGWHPYTEAVTCIADTGQNSDCGCLGTNTAPILGYTNACAPNIGRSQSPGYCMPTQADTTCVAV